MLGELRNGNLVFHSARPWLDSLAALGRRGLRRQDPVRIGTDISYTSNLPRGWRAGGLGGRAGKIGKKLGSHR